MRTPMRKPGFFPAGGSYFLHCFQRPSGLGVLFREGALPRTSVSDFTGIRDLLLGSDRSFFNDLNKCLAIQAQTCINKVQRSLPLPLPSFWLSPSHVACPLPCVSPGPRIWGCHFSLTQQGKIQPNVPSSKMEVTRQQQKIILLPPNRGFH